MSKEEKAARNFQLGKTTKLGDKTLKELRAESEAIDAAYNAAREAYAEKGRPKPPEVKAPEKASPVIDPVPNVTGK